jgi:FkbM family methyltransferase
MLTGWLIKRLRSSLSERARFYTQSQQAFALKAKLGLPSSCTASLETLNTLAAVRAHLGGSVDTLVDVGAHLGGFVVPAFHILGAKKAICFEPNRTLLPALASVTSSLCIELRPYALADQPGRGDLFIHEDASMSSLKRADKDILQRHFNTYDGSLIETKAVRVSTLDIELAGQIGNGRRFFVKLDTQGNELEVLQGANSVLKHCDGILVEHMFTTPYQGQGSFEDLIEFMKSHSFSCVAAVDIKRKSTNRISGVDFLFLPNVNKLLA